VALAGSSVCLDFDLAIFFSSSRLSGRAWLDRKNGARELASQSAGDLVGSNAIDRFDYAFLALALEFTKNVHEVPCLVATLLLTSPTHESCVAAVFAEYSRFGRRPSALYRPALDPM
jgi:hypothetical protein